MSAFDKIDGFVIPVWALCAMVNDDWSGLAPNDTNDLEVFLAEHAERHTAGHWQFPEDIDAEKYFCRNNDLNALGGEVVDASYYQNRVTRDSAMIPAAPDVIIERHISGKTTAGELMTLQLKYGLDLVNIAGGRIKAVPMTPKRREQIKAVLRNGPSHIRTSN